MYPWFNLASARDMAGRAVVPPRGTFILGPPVRTQSFHRRNTNPTHPAPSRAPDQPLIVSKFESIFQAKQYNNIELGEGGRASFVRNECDRTRFFLKNPVLRALVMPNGVLLRGRHPFWDRRCAHKPLTGEP